MYAVPEAPEIAAPAVPRFVVPFQSVRLEKAAFTDAVAETESIMWRSVIFTFSTFDVSVKRRRPVTKTAHSVNSPLEFCTFLK